MYPQSATTNAHFGPRFSPPATNGIWDQFATNEILLGVKTSFDEEGYTTKLDCSVPDFKERERKAQQIANEIMGVGCIILTYDVY